MGSTRVRAATRASSTASWARLNSNAWPRPCEAAPKKITPVTATPSELPICWTVDSAPLAAPALCAASGASEIAVRGETQSPIPAPTSTSPGTSVASEASAPFAASAAQSAP